MIPAGLNGACGSELVTGGILAKVCGDLLRAFFSARCNGG